MKQGQVFKNPLDEDEDQCAEGEYNVEVDVGLGSTFLMGVGTPSRGEGGEEAVDHSLKSVSYRGGDTVKYNEIFSDVCT